MGKCHLVVDVAFRRLNYAARTSLARACALRACYLRRPVHNRFSDWVAGSMPRLQREAFVQHVRAVCGAELVGGKRAVLAFYRGGSEAMHVPELR